MSPGLDRRLLDAVQAAGERLDERGHLGRQPGRHGQEVHTRDALGYDEQLRVRAVEQRQQLLAQRLGAAGARGARAAGRGVRSDDAPPRRDVDPAELVPERRRRLAQQQRMAAPERLHVGAVRQRHLDPDEHVAGARLRVRHLLDADVAGAVPAQRPHGTNTTLSRLAAQEELESLGEARERQHHRLGQVELRQQRDRLAHRLRRGRARADDSELAAVDGVGRQRAGVGEHDERAAGLDRLERSRRRRRRRRRRRPPPARPAARPAPARVGVDREDVVSAALEHRR